MERRYLFVIHGWEPGPEQTAQELCTHLGIDQAIYPATFALGDKAWARRNQIMIQEHNPDLVILFTHDLKHSSVVSDMLARAEARGIKTKLIDWNYINTRNSEDVDIRPVYMGR